MGIPTPHIEVKEKGIIASTVIMPGDPLRAKFIAENYLQDAVQFNKVRNMLGYTGIYRGEKISIMGSGMGMPSIGIYSYELFKFYDVERIIRIGSCGGYSSDLNIQDTVLLEESWTESTFAKVQSGCEDNILYPSKGLNELIIRNAEELGLELKKGRIRCADVFYAKDSDDCDKYYGEYKCIAVEMEAFALLANAKLLNKEAACILMVSDSFATGFVSGMEMSSEEREHMVGKMIELALKTGIEKKK